MPSLNYCVGHRQSSVSLRGIADRREPGCLGLPEDRGPLDDNVPDDRGLSENNVSDEPDCPDGDTPNCHGLSGNYGTSGRRE